MRYAIYVSERRRFVVREARDADAAVDKFWAGRGLEDERGEFVETEPESLAVHRIEADGTDGPDA